MLNLAVLFETNCWKAVYIANESIVEVMAKSPLDVNWIVIQKIYADNFEWANYVSKSYVLDLALEAINTIT